MIIDTSSEPFRKTGDHEAGGVFRESFDTLAGPLRRHSNQVLLPFVIFLLLVVYFAPKMFITVQSGQVGVLYLRFFGGTQTNSVKAEGLHILWPWDKLFVYSIRVQEATDEMTVLTTEGLPIMLRFSVRYQPEEQLVGLLHQRVGPNYKDRVVIPEVEAVIRELMAGITMEEVYGSEFGLAQKIYNQSLERVSGHFVKIDGIVLRTVELPTKVQEAVEAKVTQQELFESYKFRQQSEEAEATRKVTEAGGVKRYNDIISSSLTPNLLKLRGIEATRELVASPNTKTVIVGNTGSSLPIMLGGDK